MTEAEAIASLTQIADQGNTNVSIWLSLTFGYLTVSYLVGHALTRFQCWTVSIFYGIAAFFFASAGIGYVDSWILLYQRERTIFDGAAAFRDIPLYVEGWTLFMYGGILVSFYFMYNIRRMAAVTSNEERKTLNVNLGKAPPNKSRMDSSHK